MIKFALLISCILINLEVVIVFRFFSFFFFSNPIFQKNFLNFFELKFVDVQNLRDFDRFIYSFIVGNKRERRGGGREI